MPAAGVRGPVIRSEWPYAGRRRRGVDPTLVTDSSRLSWRMISARDHATTP